jgi:hypothetical protein
MSLQPRIFLPKEHNLGRATTQKLLPLATLKQINSIKKIITQTLARSMVNIHSNDERD